MNRTICTAIALSATLILGGCGNLMAVIAAGGTVDVMVAGAPSFDSESDLELARAGAVSNIMMMKGLLETIPEHEGLLELIAGAYASFSFGFLEADLAALEEDSDDAEALTERIHELYARARMHAQQRLNLSNSELPDLVEATDGIFATSLAGIEAEDVGPLFWFAYAWGGLINLHQDDPAWLLQLERVEALMNQVNVLDETFFEGGAHLFLAVLKASAPKSVSDETAASATHFEKALALTGGTNLMVKTLKARFLDVANGDRAAFVETLEGVMDTPANINTHHTLVNTLAKRRAAGWLANVDRFFPEN
jgi:hypothetical protein